MVESRDYPPFLRALFPEARAELIRLLAGAAENASLLRNDFCTMRDWIEQAGYRDNESALVLLTLLFAALEEGSLCIDVSRDALTRRLSDIVDAHDAEFWARSILEPAGLPALMGTSPQDHRPVIAHEVNGRRFLYFQKYLRAEMDLHRLLQPRLTGAASADPAWRAILQEVLVDQPLPLGAGTLKLDSEQALALETALLQPFTIISGGPGTGKTSIILTLLRCLVRAGIAPDRIALAAPTGRAAQRLTDSLRTGLARLPYLADQPLRGVTASTLHHLLGYRPHRNLFTRHRENTVPADVVIVDEVSMVGLVLMAQSLDALDPKTKLVLLGDKDQLPSVDAGAVLAHLVVGRKHGVVLLQTNHRSQAGIREAAQAINAQDASSVDRLPVLARLDEVEVKTGCWLLEQPLATPAEVRGFAQAWADAHYFRSKLGNATLAELVQLFSFDDGETDARVQTMFALLDRGRLLTLVRESPWGCDALNRVIEAHLRPRLGANSPAGLFAGAPVLVTRNDPARGLFNGDIGITLRSRRGGLRVVFQRQDRCVSFPAESLPSHELGFALTVHKSQGWEYGNVMLVLPPSAGKRLLTKELIYTGITRAKSLAVICSTKDALRFAIGRRIQRESGILNVS
jgi:exodeoxyribonuclease V alpha subunit